MGERHGKDLVLSPLGEGGVDMETASFADVVEAFERQDVKCERYMVCLEAVVVAARALVDRPYYLLWGGYEEDLAARLDELEVVEKQLTAWRRKT